MTTHITPEKVYGWVKKLSLENNVDIFYLKKFANLDIKIRKIRCTYIEKCQLDEQRFTAKIVPRKGARSVERKQKFEKKFYCTLAVPSLAATR